MKKLLLVAALLGLAATANAQAPFGLPVTAIGYDGQLQQITARLPLGEDNLDVGFAVQYDNGKADPFSLGLSGYYLKKTNTWGPVSLYLTGGGDFGILPKANDNVKIGLFAGLQPELTLMDRLIFSTRFGAALDLLPEFVLGTGGPKDGISIIGGVNFKVLF